jgi:hypothetical protein
MAVPGCLYGNDGKWHQEIRAVCKRQTWDIQDQVRGKTDKLRNNNTRLTMVNEGVDEYGTKWLEYTHQSKKTELLGELLQ